MVAVLSIALANRVSEQVVYGGVEEVRYSVLF